MRAIGLSEASAGPIRRIKRRAASLGLDTSHFRGKRGWSDGQLRRAVLQAHCWADVLAGLGLAIDSSSARTRIKAHAIRLGLDVSHLDSRVIAGRVGISLRAYEKFIVGNACGLMQTGRSRAA
jgi:hypothetical protein